jgi:hypothetical protein
MEHRASVKFRHLTVFLHSSLTAFQLFPILFISSFIVLLHVILGCPLLLTLWGFHSSVSQVRSLFGFRNVCPFLPHFLSLICTSIVCLVPWCSIRYLHGPSYLQNTKQSSVYKSNNLFTIFLVIFQVWHPYNNTDLTLVFKNPKLTVAWQYIFIPR